MKNKKFKAVINDETLLEDLIWMSYRYCIGRKTIAACTHADNLVSIVDNLSDSRRIFMARDIRREINDNIRWKSNITINGYNDIYDGYSLVCKYIMDHPEIKDDTDYHFYIDVDNGNVEAEEEIKQDGKYYSSIFDDYGDMLPWIKLYHYLDINKHFNVITEYNDKIEEHTCFKCIYVFQKNIKELYIDVNTYRTNPHLNTHINPEYILKK